MHPCTKINWIDQTIENNNQPAQLDNRALFLTASSFEKGPEGLTRVYGKKFYDLFGYNNRFSKHGQAAIQASKIIDAGGELLVKRVVADDATLANVIFVATLNKSNTTPVDPDDPGVVDPPVPSTEASIPEQTTQWLGHSISEMVGEDLMVAEDGSVYGSFHYVTGFHEFYEDKVEEQSGYYFPVVLNLTGTTMTLLADGVETKKDIQFDPEILLRVDGKDNEHQIVIDGTTTITFNFKNATFEPQGGGEAVQVDEEGTVTPTPPMSDVEDNPGDDEVVPTASVKWSAVYIENCYSYEEVIEEAKKLFDPEAGVYPLIVAADNGRGKSAKRVCITADPDISLSIGKEFYGISIYEGTTRIDNISATLNSVIYNNVQYGLDEHSSIQVKFNIDPDIYEEYVTAVADVLGVDFETADSYDLINMTNLKGVALDGIEVDTESIDLSVAFGVEMNGGSNGEFGDFPVDTDPWTQALVEFYSGQFTNEIYDLDEFKIGACLDANYPYEVKDAIAQLATFREDFVFFRDMKCEANSYGSALAIRRKFKIRNKFIADYMTYYQIYDPHTKKRIRVTMMYDLAGCLVEEFNTGIHYPTAGIANGFILESAIEGTVNFIPRITPEINQKQLIDDLRVNYAIFQNGKCVLQSLYTSQEVDSQLSYVNNVLGIQEVVRSVRTSCPKKRYTFVNNGDFSEYAELVNNVLKNFKSNFDFLEFEYYQDSILAHKKIFYGAIRFAFKDWAQTEIFDVYAINNDMITN